MRNLKSLESSLNSEKSIRKIEMLDRTFGVVDYIFQNRIVTFTEIKENLNIAKSTLHRILYTLESNNYIERDKTTNEYRLGLLFAYYGEEVKSRLTIINICESILSALALKIGESVNISILYRDSVLNILTLEGEESVLTSRLIPVSPLNCSGTGKIFLSQRNDIELLDYFASNNWEKRTANSIITYDDFKKEKEQILKDELAFDNEEYEYGLFCIAKPLKNHKGWMETSVSITGPITRMKMKRVDYLIKELTESTNQINDILTNIKYVYRQA